MASLDSFGVTPNGDLPGDIVMGACFAYALQCRSRRPR